MSDMHLNYYKQISSINELDWNSVTIDFSNIHPYEYLNEKDYYIFDKDILVEHNEDMIYKIGYSCEPSGIYYPIQITFDNYNEGSIEKWFALNKQGMFEIQEEAFKDIANKDAETVLLSLDIVSIAIPADINFQLDYAYRRMA